MSISIRCVDTPDYNSPDPVTGLPKKTQVLQFIDDSGTVVGELASNANGTESASVGGESVETSDTVAVKKASVTLTDAQIKALPTTGVDVLEALGADSRYVIIGGAVVADFTGGGYANVDATEGNGFYIASGVAISGIVPLNSYFSENYLAYTAQPFTFEILPRIIANVGLGDGNMPNLTTFDAIFNQPLTIKYDNNGAGNFTGGNAANSLKLVILYKVISL